MLMNVQEQIKQCKTLTMKRKLKRAIKFNSYFAKCNELNQNSAQSFHQSRDIEVHMAYIRRDDLMGGFLHYEFGGLIFGGAYFCTFGVSHTTRMRV